MILQRQGDTYRKERSDLPRGAACIRGQARYFAFTTTDVRENSSYINKSFAIDKLLALKQ